MNPRGRLLHIFALVFGREVGADLTREDPDWDSVRHIEILTAVMEEFEVQFGADEIGGLTSFAAILAEVERQLAARGG